MANKRLRKNQRGRERRGSRAGNNKKSIGRRANVWRGGDSGPSFLLHFPSSSRRWERHERTFTFMAEKRSVGVPSFRAAAAFQPRGRFLAATINGAIPFPRGRALASATPQALPLPRHYRNRNGSTCWFARGIPLPISLFSNVSAVNYLKKQELKFCIE